MKEIPLTQGYVALVDDEDYDKVCTNKWQVLINRNKDGSPRNIYARRSIPRDNGKRKTILMHWLIVDALEGSDMDHVDGNGLNNTRRNLRVCNRTSNLCNMAARSGCTSRYKGVSFYKQTNKWKARAYFDGKCVYSEYHKTELDAARAYNAAAIKHFGEFARLNILDND